jgi:D-cysteine desulfhydrase
MTPLGAGLPRCGLATLPTPLLAAPRLSEAVGVAIWIKRDDMTGLGLGGNKARKLEFLCGEALARGADTLVTGGGSGSNHVQLTAAAAARLGLGCVAVCYGSAPAAGEPLGLRLTRRFGAEVLFTGSPDRASVDVRLDEVAAKLVAEGRHPYVIPRGGASAVGAVGYALAAAELADQLASAGLSAATLLLATGSCGTQAGLLAGAELPSGIPAGIVPESRDDLCPDPEKSAGARASGGAGASGGGGGGAGFDILGVPVSRPPEECVDRIAGLATGCAERLGSDRVFTAGEVHLLGGYIGPGYGKASPEGDEAALLAARTEGLVLDPVFTAKAMAALVAEGRRGALTGPIVFLHTGGAPAALAALP